MSKAQHIPTLKECLNIGESTAWLWLKDDAGEAYQRRVQAAITSERTDWTPIEPKKIEAEYGVTIKEVADWYGYNAHTLYDVTSGGRYESKRPKKAATLIDYYLKQQGIY